MVATLSKMADRARLLRQGLPRVSIDGDPRRVSDAWEVGGGGRGGV